MVPVISVVKDRFFWFVEYEFEAGQFIEVCLKDLLTMPAIGRYQYHVVTIAVIIYFRLQPVLLLFHAFVGLIHYEIGDDSRNGTSLSHPNS